MPHNERAILLERCLRLEAVVHHLLGELAHARGMRRTDGQDTERVCRQCLQLKPIKRFALLSRGYRMRICTKCRNPYHRIYMRNYRKRKREAA